MKTGLLLNTDEKKDKQIKKLCKSMQMRYIRLSYEGIPALLQSTTNGVLFWEIKNWGKKEKATLNVINTTCHTLQSFVIIKSLDISVIQCLFESNIDVIIDNKGSLWEIEKGTEALSKNEKFVSYGILDQLSQQYHFLLETKMNRNSLESKLTERELEIVALIKSGFSSKMIAAKLCLSSHTVTTHRKNIFKKLGVHNVAELIEKSSI